MANKPSWVDNCPAVCKDGSTEMLAECFKYCKSIRFERASNGRYFAYIYMQNQDKFPLPINRSRDKFKDLIIAIQELLLP